MDSTNTANVTDDQELAKVLESMNQQATAGAPVVPPTDDQAATPVVPADDVLSFEETPEAPAETAPDAPAEPTVPEPTLEEVEQAATAASAAADTLTAATVTGESSPELDAIKKNALEELRPLVDKLDLPADEKFDTLLLIIRSTDDKTLVSAAHDAARAIEDETKRAQALLDVIKEIDYFSGHGQQPA